MRDIKFRQAIFKDGKFSHWHYWGYVGHHGSFVAPIEIWQQSSPPTYEIKDSQEYIGVHIGELGLGEEIYEGDILSPIEQLAHEENQLVRYGVKAAGFVTSGDLQFDECDKIIGNVYETPEFIPGQT